MVLTLDEFERFQLADMALNAIGQIERGDHADDYVDANDVAIEFARDAIVEARKKAGLTQKQLGERLGLPQSQISRIERRPDRTTVRTLRRLARALRVDVRVFLRGL
ncbi:MAG: helix-turn-helix transcriptional regulator [Phycisphaerales bacterium]|nr:helix-turn-helix transcriptional regulator [Phycisphaerales bacterium]